MKHLCRMFRRKNKLPRCPFLGFLPTPGGSMGKQEWDVFFVVCVSVARSETTTCNLGREDMLLYRYCILPSLTAISFSSTITLVKNDVEVVVPIGTETLQHRGLSLSRAGWTSFGKEVRIKSRNVPLDFGWEIALAKVISVGCFIIDPAKVVYS